MRREKKLIISLIVVLCLMVVFTVSSFATSEPQTITAISVGSSNNTTNESGAVPITISGNNNTASGTTAISTGNNTVNNTANNTSATSSYNNTTNTTKSSGLPYTGSSYGIVFVIIALVISSVYAYKKVTDYNM